MTQKPILFFVTRHGITAGNEADKYRGWSNSPEARLNAEGRDGIREAALWYKKAQITFPLIMSDDLDRALESREILGDILGIKDFATDKRLRPLNVGDYTGKSKSDHPLERFIKNRNLKIPGGESMKEFDKREAEVFDDVAGIVQKLNKPILIIGHGSTISFLYNNFNQKGDQVGYEGLVHPGGNLMFTSEGIEPLTRRKFETISPLKDGTALSGFCDEEESVPPRECWNCRSFARDIQGLGSCLHPVVRIDPQLVERRQDNGTVAVGEKDFCNYFRNAVKT